MGGGVHRWVPVALWSDWGRGFGMIVGKGLTLLGVRGADWRGACGRNGRTHEVGMLWSVAMQLRGHNSILQSRC